VLSTYAASGKSFVMANLAVSLSHQIDRKVLLIDADMRCPMVHKIFQYQNNCGLSNLLAGQVTDQASVKHQLGSLDIITAGTLPPNPIELLSGPNMEKLMEKWKKEYDYILVDLPPVGEVSDAVAVSRLISGYLFVVRSGINDARAIGECCDLIQSRGAKIYGLKSRYERGFRPRCPGCPSAWRLYTSSPSPA
jgi:capsular exopolysaccharide synthesis family protein